MDRREEVTRSGFLFPTLRRVDSSTDVPDTPGSNPSSPGSTASLKGSVAGAVSKFMALAAQARRKYARPRQEAEENPSHRELPSVGSAPLPETASKGGLEASASGRTHTGFWDFTSKTWVPHGDGMLAREASAGAEAGHPGGWEMPEELGAATWTLLRAVAVQFPDSPGEAQRRGVETLIESLSQAYPCPVCAEHFQELLRDHPPVLASGPQLREWVSDFHGMVTRGLGKSAFNCHLAHSRWTTLRSAIDDGSCTAGERMGSWRPPPIPEAGP